MAINPDGYPVFKGLQKPLEFMGIRGRFLILGGAGIGVSFGGGSAVAISIGKRAGLSGLRVMAVAGLLTIYVKQKGGLHNKKRHRGVFIYTHLFRK